MELGGAAGELSEEAALLVTLGALGVRLVADLLGVPWPKEAFGRRM